MEQPPAPRPERGRAETAERAGGKGVEALRKEAGREEDAITAKIRRQIQERPEASAKDAIRRFETAFQSALNRGRIDRETLDAAYGDLSAAHHALEEKQAELTAAPEQKKTVVDNWHLIKRLERLMEIAGTDPEESALEEYTAYRMEQTAPERAMALESRKWEIGPKLEQASRKVHALEKQIRNVFGVNADMLLAGAKPKKNRARYVLGKLVGGDALMKQWRTARAEEDALAEDLQPSMKAAIAGEGESKAAVRRRKGVIRREAARRGGRSMAEEAYGPAAEKSAEEFEREYLGEAEEAEEAIPLTRRKEAEPITLTRIKRPAETKISKDDAFYARQAAKEAEKGRIEAAMDLAENIEDEGRKTAVLADIDRIGAKLAIPAPPAEVFKAGARAEAINERRARTMTIERAAALVPNADKLWDYASGYLKAHPEAGMAFARGPGSEMNAATNYVLTLARYKEAVQAQDDQWATEMWKRVQKMNKALGMSDGNALFQSALAEPRAVKDVLKGSKERARSTARRQQRGRIGGGGMFIGT